MRWSPPVLAVAVALALGACGGEETPSSAGATTTTPAATAPPAAAAPAGTTSAEPSPAPATTQATTPSRPARAPRPAREERPAPATTPDPAPPADESAPAPATTQARAPEPRAAPDPEPAGTQLDELAVLHLVERASPRDYTQEGSVTGTYDGTMRLTAKITNRGVLVSFVATVEGGTIEGSGVTRPIITGKPLAEIDGTMDVTGGSGRFASIRGRRLSVTGHARLDGTYARVRLVGPVTY